MNAKTDIESIKGPLPEGRYAPVAEYKGVALLEREGSRRAVWDGAEYGTDGNIYIFAKNGLAIEILEIPTEQDAKFLLDDRLVGDRLLQIDDDTRLRLLSHVECAHLLCSGDPGMLETALSQQPCTEWCDTAGVFIQAGSSVSDGQHRHHR